MKSLPPTPSPSLPRHTHHYFQSGLDFFLFELYSTFIGKIMLGSAQKINTSAILLLCILILKGPEQNLKGKCTWKIQVGNILLAIFMRYLEGTRGLQFKIYQSFGFYSFPQKKKCQQVFILQLSVGFECFS